MQKLAHDLRTTLSTIYPSILKRLLKLFPRSLEPAALTVLLETLASLFRYLLVPSIHTELITHSWGAIRLILPKCLPEIQRAIAEVWGSVLRRLKTASREHAVKLLAENVEGLEDVSAWAIVFSSKVCFIGSDISFPRTDDVLSSQYLKLYTLPQRPLSRLSSIITFWQRIQIRRIPSYVVPSPRSFTMLKLPSNFPSWEIF